KNYRFPDLYTSICKMKISMRIKN
ncbi:polymorphic outer membrane protein, partial [Chlamydia psittaci 08-2626_L3]